MKNNLFLISNSRTCQYRSRSIWGLFLLAFVFFVVSFNGNAQCTSPNHFYTVFEGFRGNVTTPCTPTLIAPCQINGYTSGGAGTSVSGNTNWWISSGVGAAPSAGLNCSGTKAMQFNSNGSYIILPKIISSNSVTLTFFYRNAALTTQSNLIVEYTTSSYTSGDPASLTWTQLGSTVNSTSATWNSSNFFTATFTPGTGYTIRIRRTNAAVVSPIIDDLAWTSSLASDNKTIVLPTQFTATSGATCTTATLSASSSYSFYDNGGVSDNYGGVASQDHTITFTPAANEIVQLTVNSFSVSGGPSTGALYITDTDNTVAASGFAISDGLANSFNPTSPATTTASKVFNSTRCDGKVTVRFTTTSNNAAGFDITVKSIAVSCNSPTSFVTSSVGQTTAAFTWVAPCPVPTAGYDYYISTNPSATLPDTITAVTTSSTSQLLVGTVANTPLNLSVSNLISGQTYYAWIRSNCSSGTYSNWTSYVSFTTLCAAIAVPATYTLDFQSSPVIPSCTTMFPTGAFNSGNNGSDNFIISSTPNAWFVTQALNLTAGFTYSFSFDAAVSLAVSSSFVVKYYSTSGAITAADFNTLGTQINSGTTSSGTFTNFASTFSPTTSGTYYIGIYLTSNPVNIRIDNIVVKQVCGPKTWNGSAWSPNPLVAPTVNDDLIFDGDYTGAGNSVLNGCSCTVNSGKNVVFNSGDLLFLSEKVTVQSGGNLTFNNNASLVQAPSIGNANAGNITYIRNTTPVVKYDYTYWSSPVSSFTLSQLSPNTSWDAFFKYNPSISNWQLLASSTVMDAGVGYIIRVPNTTTSNPLSAVPYTAIFVGVPNNGEYTTPIVGSRVNLIGNPYPSAISALSLVDDSANNSVLGGTLYFWTHNTPLTANVFTFNDYSLWNKLGGTGTRAALNSGVNNTIPDGTIAAGQSFFIDGLLNGNAMFRNSMRLSSGNDRFYRTSSPGSTTQDIERHRIWLDISNREGAYKQMLIGYIEGGTSGIDRSFDAEVFDVGNPILLYSLVENKKLSIEGRGLTFSENDTVSLGYKSASNGDFSISLSNFDGLFTGQDIYLEDKLLNVIHDLKAEPYTFSTQAGTFEDRFVLRFTTTALGLPTFTQNSVIVYENGEGVHVTTGAVPMSAVSIYDIMGRLVTERHSINATQTTFDALTASKQVLIVKITSVDGVVVTKKIVY